MSDTLTPGNLGDDVGRHLLELDRLLKASPDPAGLEAIMEQVRRWMAEKELLLLQEPDVPGFDPGKTEDVDLVFCESTGQGKKIGPGGGEGIDLPEATDRVQEFERLLEAHGFKGCYDLKIGRPGTTKFDRFPYYLFTFLKKARGQVLVSSGSKAGTYVSDEIRPPQAYAGSKNNLRQAPGIQFVRYDSKDQWEATMLGFLGGYYRSRLHVQRDLSEFARQAGVTTEKLSAEHMKHVTIRCSNGQQLNGPQYLSIAVLSFGWATGSRDSYAMQSTGLDELKRIAYGIHEYNKRDALYFTDAGNIRHDLEAFAAATGTTPQALVTGHIESVTIRTKSGGRVTGDTYLREGGIAFGMAENARGASKGAEYLAALKRAAGYPVVTTGKMHAPYFHANVAADLATFAAGVHTSVAELTAGMIGSTRIRCANGEEVTGNAYVLRAGVALGIAKNQTEAANKSHAVFARLQDMIRNPQPPPQPPVPPENGGWETFLATLEEAGQELQREA